jgi:hypothetical protein
MKEKKNIDELFKEKLSSFEAAPSANVWNNIQTKMKAEKEERKVIPIWWKVAGVAALLALLFTIGSQFYNASPTTEIVTEDKKDTINTNKTNNTITSSENTVIASEDDIKTENLEKTTKASDNNTKANSNNDVFNKTSTSKNDAIAVEEIKKNNSNKGTENTSVEKNPRFKDNTFNSVKETVVATTSSEKSSEKEKKEKNKLETGNDNFDIIDTNKTVDTEKVTVATEETNSEKEANDVSKETEISTNKKSIYDAIEESKTEEAIAKVDRTPGNRWDVTPNFAPVYYNSLGEGSSIDPSFADNAQSGDVNFSYGVQVSYNITDRLSLRSGVSNVDVSYATGGVELGTGPVSQALSSINYGGRQVVLTAFDSGTLMNASGENGDPFSNITPKSTSGDVELIQNISYFEVPLELKYAVLNKKFGVNLIGGFSTLFLGNNDITAQASNFSETLGEANNLSSVSFSTNVGIGFDYKISRKFKFNIEPMFKYQLNPYTDSSVNFRPYYLGVYTGLSFKF